MFNVDILKKATTSKDNCLIYCKSGKRDSNPRPLAWEANALPTELLPHLRVQIYDIILFFLTFEIKKI